MVEDPYSMPLRYNFRKISTIYEKLKEENQLNQD